MERPDRLERLRALLLEVAEDGYEGRDLDARVFAEVSLFPVEWKIANFSMVLYPVVKRPSSTHRSGFRTEPVPAVTTSLDGAWSFMDEHMYSLVRLASHHTTGPGRYTAFVMKNNKTYWSGSEVEPVLQPAAAITAAVLVGEIDRETIMQELARAGQEQGF